MAVLTPQHEDFPRWYQDVLTKAKLAENGPARGTMVIRPERVRDLGANAGRGRRADQGGRRAKRLLPAAHPRDLPSTARPSTSRASAPSSPSSPTPAARSSRSRSSCGPPARRSSASTWRSGSQSYRDLPLLLNQWANVVRWELRPRIFLRTTEFLWQEGHTAHATQDDAPTVRPRGSCTTSTTTSCCNVLAMPVIVGRKTAQERFAGAMNTMTCEAMMRDGKALQMGTSHELGQNFAVAFDISYSDAEGAHRAVLDHLVGHVDPHARRADHVPWRRLRPASAAGAGAGPGRRCGGQGHR